MKEATNAAAAKEAATAKPAKAAKPATAAKPAKAAKTAKAIGTLCLAAAMSLFAMACATNITRTPILSEGGDGETVVAYATNVKLGLGTKDATSIGTYKLSATGGLDITGLDQQVDSATTVLQAIKLGSELAMARMAPAAAAAAVSQPAANATSQAVESDSPTTATLPAETVANPQTTAKLSEAMAKAKKEGKPLVVLAGNTGCGFCLKMDRIIDADASFLARTNIVFYRETSAWESNQAAKWTGGGKLPVLRVTQWDADGTVVCDKKVNRPQSVADIDAALSTCEKAQ